MRPRLASVISTLTLLLACGGGAAPHSATVVDSAGVTIVTNTAAQIDRATERTLAAEPSLTIDTPGDGSFTLFQVRALAPLSAGRLAVANGKPPEILVFGEDGALVARFGQDGDGPGEFRSIGSIAVLPGDSIAVFDAAAGRLSVFDGDGAFAHDADLMRTITDANGYNWATHVLSLANGDLVLFTGSDFNTDRSRHDGPFRAESESMRIQTDGAVVASYGRFPGLEVFAHIQGASGSPFFGAATDAATIGDDLVVGTEGSPELRTYGPDGALARIVRWPDHDRTVTQERVNDFLDTLMAHAPEAQRTATMRAMMAKLPHAEREPAYRTLVTSVGGDLWAGSYDPFADRPDLVRVPRHWLVFSPDGTVTATIDTPAGFAPKVVRGARVLGVFTDSIGVESVRAYDLQEM